MGTIKKAIGYCRVSTEVQDLERQKKQIQDYCDRKSYELVDVITEKVSGAKRDKESIKKLLEIDDSIANIVVVSELSRISRENEIMRVLNTINDLLESGLNIVFLDEENKIYPAGKVAGIIDKETFDKANYALVENPLRLTNITIGNGVTTIGQQAFRGCSELKEIHNNNPIPQSIDNNCFSDVNKTTCKLYVPHGSYSAYWIAGIWGDFANIIEENITANNLINNDNISIFNISNGIRIQTKQSTPITIYNLSGQLVYQSNIQGDTNINLDKGIYIVRTGNDSQKIVVR